MQVIGERESSKFYICTIWNMLHTKKAENVERWLSERRETGPECLLKTAGPHTELKQEIPAFGGRGDIGTAKEG